MRILLGKGYFFIQQLCFARVGINPLATQKEHIIKEPLFCFIPLLCCILHSLAILHYVFVNMDDYMELTGALTVVGQSSIAIFKMFIFLGKRNEFVEYIRKIHSRNLNAKHGEFSIILTENAKDYLTASVYFAFVIATTVVGLLHPIFNAVFVYIKRGELELEPPHKATYFWNYSHIPGYSIVYIWNFFSLYFIASTNMAFDTLFSWLICNIMAQFRILFHRLHKTATALASVGDACNMSQHIIACIQYHCKILELADKLNKVYGGIVFFKFIVSCLQICCLAFRLTRADGSLVLIVHESLFLIAVAIQLCLYCFNGQSIKDQSLEVSSEIYAIFEWSQLPKSYKQFLLISMMRSQKSCNASGVFFTVDLSLYLWVFKTAGSLITALKTLEEDQ